jgi:hypothetical protein
MLFPCESYSQFLTFGVLGLTTFVHFQHRSYFLLLALGVRHLYVNAYYVFS